MMKKIIVTSLMLAGLVGVVYAQGNGNCAEGNRAFMNEHGMHKMHRMHEGFNKGMHKGHKRGKNSLMNIFRENREALNLTKEQKIKIRTIMQEQRAKMKELRALNVKKYKMNLSNFMNSAEFNKEAFKAELDKARASRMEQNVKLKDKRADILAESFSKIFDILTVEQREKLIQLSKK